MSGQCERCLPCAREEPPDHEGNGGSSEAVADHRLGLGEGSLGVEISFAAQKGVRVFARGGGDAMDGSIAVWQ